LEFKAWRLQLKISASNSKLENKAMSIFRDPIESLSVELPAGWTFDPLNSSLTDFFFSRWDKPDELLAICIRRAAVAEGDKDENWIEQIREEVGEANSLTDIPCSSGRAVAATFISKQGLARRVAFVHGRRVDLSIEQRGADLKASDLWAPLNRAVRTAASAANIHGRDCGPDEFNQCIESANQGFENKDLPSALKALKEAVQTGISIWLQSLAAPEGRLEINAPIRVAQALLHLGRFTDNPYLLRDAEFILRRGQRTLEYMGPITEGGQELGKEMEEVLQSILADSTAPSNNSGEPISPLLAMRERAFRTTQAAARAFEAQDEENAENLAAMAIEDLLSLFSSLRRDRIEIMPEDISAHLSSKGIIDPEDQREALHNAREAVLLPPMNMSLQIRHSCALKRQDAESAEEAASIMLPLARLLSNADPGDAGIARNLALALIISSGTIAMTGNEVDTEEATRLLNEAERALNGISGQSSANDGWIRYHGKQIEATLRELDRRMASGPEIAGRQPLRSRLAEISARFQIAAAKLEISSE
jgi:hypothetical protein